MRLKHRLSATISTLILAISASSCAQIQQPPSADSPTQVTEFKSEKQRTDAAQELFSLAAQSQAPTRQKYLLQAADILLQGGRITQAKNTLAALKDDALEHGQRIRKQFLMAEISLKEMNQPQTYELIKALDDAHLSAPDYAKRLHQLKVAAYQQFNRPLHEAQERIELIPYLGSTEEQQANNQRLLELMISFSEESVAQLLEKSGDNKTSAEIDTLREMLQKWAEARPIPMLTEHSQTEEALQLTSQLPPEKIAILLPLSGRHTQAGEIIRDGILSAQFVSPSSYRPTLNFYDTQGDPQIAWQAMQQASIEGADFVIGPLTKEEVNYFALAPELPLPLLSLNYTSDEIPIPEKMYQFGLSPENEAAQAAAQAWDHGLRNPVILVPGNSWGERIAEAFAKTWQALGGEIRSEQAYAAKEKDFSDAIRRAFELDTSDNRHRLLQRTIGHSLKFFPRRRQDVDFIFLAAQPMQARLLRPQLKFHYAGDLPIYSTSHVYSGKLDTKRDRDMDDIIFGDSPWTLDDNGPHPLRSKILEIWPNADEKLWRLYALGIDAYALSGMLNTLPFNISHYGESGQLYLTSEHQIYRILEWAKFRRGRPQPLL